MAISVRKTGATLEVAGHLEPHELKALAKYSPKPDDILNSIDELNDSFATDLNIGEWENTKVPQIPESKTVKIPERSVTDIGPRKATTAVGSSFDDELDALANKLEKPVPQVAVAEQLDQHQALKNQILEVFHGMENAPSDQQIQRWKQEHGQNAVHLIAFGPGEAFVFTHLKRAQWKKIQEILQRMKAQNPNADETDELKEKVVQNCILFPRLPVEFFYNSRAGLLDAMFELIMVQSYFLTPQQTMLMTTTL